MAQDPTTNAPSGHGPDSDDVDRDSDVGRTIGGRYRITRSIGEGGMGVVYEAHDPQVDRKVAIKLVRRSALADEKFMTRFRRELEITAALRHPSTVRVFEHGESADGRPFMVMELLTGQCLADVLDQRPIDEVVALQYARQIAESLSEAHENGIFHRDLKPENIYIETVGVSTVVKVLDFGIAGGIDSSRLTRAGEVFGTPDYMSPEQCNGQPLDHRTDIYSLGCVLFEMIEGDPPFHSDEPMATMLKHVRNKAPMPRRCSRDTAKLIFSALRKDRSKRIQRAGRFAELLGKCIGEARDAKGANEFVDSGSHEIRLPTGTSLQLPNRSFDSPTFNTPNIPQAQPNVSDSFLRHFKDGPGVAMAAGVALLAITLVVFTFGGDGDSNSQGSEPEKPEEPAVATAAPEIVLPRNRSLITTNIEGASVWLDGKEICNTPCYVEVPVGDNLDHKIKLVKDGYVDVLQVWQPKSVIEEPPEFADLGKKRR